jgi:peptidyl-prolyl cis-trans isomerase D
MLSLIRAFARSPFAMALILIPIILAFALFGVTGIFTGSGTAIVIVGNEQVSQRELAREYDRELRQRQRDDLGFTREQAQAEGLGDTVLNRMILEAALNSKANELDLVISPEALRDVYAAFPQFQNPVTGEYDRDTARSLLAQDGQTVEQFLETLGNDLRRRQLILSLLSAVDTPVDFATTRYLVGEERRSMRALIIDTSTAQAIPDPTDEQLQEFIDGNRGLTDSNGLPLFVAPEMRSFGLVRFRLQDYVANVEVDETTLRETYDYELETGQIGTPARRGFVQIMTPDEATANAVAARLSAGEIASEVATDMALGEPVTLDDVETYEVPDIQMADAVFALPLGAISAIEGNLGWSAVQVTLAVDAVVPSYEERLPEMRANVARDEALNNLYDKMAIFEGARADGASLETAAETAEIEFETMNALDRFARDESGELDIARDLEIGDDVLGLAFETFAGFPTELQQYNDTDFFILRVDEVTAERPRELTEVREQAEARWRETQVDTQLEASASDALTQLQAGEDMDFVALLAGGRVEAATLQRSQQTGGAFGQNVVMQAFGQEVGEYAQAFQTGPLQKIIIIVDEIIPGDVASAELGEIGTIGNRISDEIVNDLGVALEAALIAEYDITNAPIDARLRAAALGERDPTQ